MRLPTGMKHYITHKNVCLCIKDINKIAIELDKNTKESVIAYSYLSAPSKIFYIKYGDNDDVHTLFNLITKELGKLLNL